MDLLKSVAKARVIIPKRAEVIFSPDKMFKERDLPLDQKVDDFIKVTSRHSKINS